jgi:cysteine desulfurase/selenocysteine lyase
MITRESIPNKRASSPTFRSSRSRPRAASGWSTSTRRRLSQKPQAVIDALVDYYESYNANIHRGVYEIAARATDAFEAARAKVARFVNAAHTAEIIWTRNTTEAINLVSVLVGAAEPRPGDAILTTQLEHHSNLVPWQLLAAKTGAALRFIPADDDGDAGARRPRRAARGVKLVALTHVEQHARLDRTARHDRPARARRRRGRAGRRRAVGAAHAGRRASARRRLSGRQRPQDVRSDRDRFSVRQARAARSDAAVPHRRRHDRTRRLRDDLVQRTALEVRGRHEQHRRRDRARRRVRLPDRDRDGVDSRARNRLTRYALERLATLEPTRPRRLRAAARADRGGVISFNFGDIHAHDLASILDSKASACAPATTARCR